MKNIVFPAALAILLILAGCTYTSPANGYNVTPNATQNLSNNATPAASSVLAAANPSYGQILTDANGMTLYVFTKDQLGISNCHGQCASLWPPMLANEIPAVTGASGTFGLITRNDSTLKQVTYNGMPLYLWAKDKAPGDTTGQGVGGVWFVAQTGLTTFPAPIPQNTTQNATQNVTQNATANQTNQAPPAVKVTSNPAYGQMLVDANGFTLYVFNQDRSGVSTCTGGCASNWPPVVSDSIPQVSGAPGTFGFVTGSKQLAYNGMPLYRYAGDSAAGQANGNGITHWYVATTNLTTFPQPPSPPSSGGYGYGGYY